MLWGQLMPFRAEPRPVSPGSSQQRHSASSFPSGTELPGKPKEDVRRVYEDERVLARSMEGGKHQLMLFHTEAFSEKVHNWALQQLSAAA